MKEWLKKDATIGWLIIAVGLALFFAQSALHIKHSIFPEVIILSGGIIRLCTAYAWPNAIKLAPLLIVAFYFGFFIEALVSYLVIGLILVLIPKDSRKSNWLYENDKLNDEELAQKAIKDVSYAGLMYMASRENPATQSHIAKITNLMNAHFEIETFPVMVTININEERMGQSTHGKIIADIKVMLQHLPQEALTTINSIFHRFAFDADVTTPLIEQGYHDLMSVVEGK